MYITNILTKKIMFFVTVVSNMVVSQFFYICVKIITIYEKLMFFKLITYLVTCVLLWNRFGNHDRHECNNSCFAFLKNVWIVTYNNITSYSITFIFDNYYHVKLSLLTRYV